jgi:protein transport protein SEC24
MSMMSFYPSQFDFLVDLSEATQKASMQSPISRLNNIFQDNYTVSGDLIPAFQARSK